MDDIKAIIKKLWQVLCYEKMPQKTEDELKKIYDFLESIDLNFEETLQDELENIRYDLKEAHGEAEYWEEAFAETHLIRDNNDELKITISDLTNQVSALERDLRQYKKLGEQFSAANKTAKLFRKGLS